MIIAAFILSATLLLVFAPVVLAWIAGVVIAVAVVGAVAACIWRLFVSILGDSVVVSNAAYRTATAGPRLPRGDAAKGLAVIFGPLVAAQLASYVLSVETANDVWWAVILAYIIGVPLWMFREYRRKP